MYITMVSYKHNVHNKSLYCAFSSQYNVRTLPSGGELTPP